MASRAWRRRLSRPSALASSILAPVRFFEPGRKPEILDVCGEYDLFGRGVADQHIIYRVAIVVPGHPHPGGGISLGIAVYQQDFEAFKRQAGGKIDGGGGFSNSTF